MKKQIVLFGLFFWLLKVSLAQTTDKGNGLYEIKLPNSTLQIDANSGGRISSLKIGSKEFLYTNKSGGDNWGSTFWTSPQSQWGWPPSANINSKPYKGSIVKDKIELTGQKDEKLGLSVNKTFSAGSSGNSFIVKYTIENTTAEKKSVAPWEITRVMPKGLTLFPTGNKAKRGDLVPLLKDSTGITWFQYKEDKIPSGVPKFFGDGSEGWMAQVWDGSLLIKRFDNVDMGAAAPEESEIELYTSPDKNYVEIEQQGAFKTLQPGEKYDWEVEWYIVPLPQGISSEAGNKNLVNYIRDIVKGKKQ